VWEAGQAGVGAVGRAGWQGWGLAGTGSVRELQPPAWIIQWRLMLSQATDLEMFATVQRGVHRNSSRNQVMRVRIQSEV